MTEAIKNRLSELDLTGRSFLTIHDFTPAEVTALLDLASVLKAAQKAREPHAVLAGRAVAMIFMKTSTRTRMSFEVGIEQLGAQPMFLNANDIQLRVGETIKDTANVMSRYVDCHHDPHLRPEGRGGPRRLRPDPRDQRPHRRPSPLPGHGRRAHDPRALRPPRGREARLHRRRQQRHPLARRGRRQDRHARRRLHARGLPSQHGHHRPGAGGREGHRRHHRADQRRRRRRQGRRRDLHRHLHEHGPGGGARRPPGRAQGLPGERRDARAGRAAGQGHALPAGALGRGDHRRGAVLAATPWSSTRRRTGCTRRRPSWRRSSRSSLRRRALPGLAEAGRGPGVRARPRSSSGTT